MDPSTGLVEVRRLVAVDDYGVVVNPLVVQGQTYGSIVMGLGQALAQARGRSIVLKPLRDAPTDQEVVVRSEVTGKGDPIELDFRLTRVAPSWKIYDMNVGGVWLVDNYRSTFAQEISAGGIDGLIAKLSEKNKAGAKG